MEDIAECARSVVFAAVGSTHLADELRRLRSYLYSGLPIFRVKR